MAEIFQPFGITATSGGLTTGLIPAHAFTGSGGFITITSSSAGDIVTLPPLADVVTGARCRFYIGATGCEVRTPADSDEEINSENGDGTKEAAIPATHYFEVTKVDDTDGWLLVGWSEAGAIATVTPD
jgi:hypothetical protein